MKTPNEYNILAFKAQFIFKNEHTIKHIFPYWECIMCFPLGLDLGSSSPYLIHQLIIDPPSPTHCTSKLTIGTVQYLVSLSSQLDLLHYSFFFTLSSVSSQCLTVWGGMHSLSLPLSQSFSTLLNTTGCDSFEWSVATKAPIGCLHHSNGTLFLLSLSHSLHGSNPLHHVFSPETSLFVCICNILELTQTSRG